MRIRPGVYRASGNVGFVFIDSSIRYCLRLNSFLYSRVVLTKHLLAVVVAALPRLLQAEAVAGGVRAAGRFRLRAQPGVVRLQRLLGVVSYRD